MKFSTIHNTLSELGTKPTKSLGQNFLHDQNVAAWIVDQLELKPNEHLIEIGPGLGALTEFAIEQCGSATLIEKDGRLVTYLAQRFGAKPNVEILHQDALEYDVRELFPHGPVKVLGNLPYYVSSQVLFQFTDEPSPVSRLVFTVQKEMAERLSAKPSTKEYGALTLIIGRRWRVHYAKTLPGTVFTPAPNVESAVIVLSPREPGELEECNGKLFNRLVKEGFSQRRKMLRKMLASHHLDWAQICATLEIPETVRGEALSLEQWIRLTNLVENAPATKAQDVHGELFDVVDENNEVVRQASRHEVHTGKLRHRAVHIFVFNRQGELFLQKRSQWKDAHPGAWDSSAAGHLNAGDDYEVTAAREVEEELGVQADVGLVGEVAACEATGQEFVQLFQARHNGPFFLPRAEIETGGFFPIPIIDRWVTARPQDFATGFLECYRLWRESGAAVA